MQEIWKDIVIEKNGIIYDFTGYYQVSNLGRVKSLERKTDYIYKLGGKHIITEKYIKLYKNQFGYLKCYLYKNGKKEEFKVHRLVANAFIPNPNKLPQINHLDKNKENNNVLNLVWCTNKENTAYSKNKKVLQYDLKRNFIREWASATNVEEKMNISRSKISLVCSGYRKTAGGYIWKFKEENNE